MAMRARLGRLWDGSEERNTSSETKGKSGSPGPKRFPIRMIVAVLVALFVLVYFYSSGTSFSRSERGVDSQSLIERNSKAQSVPTTTITQPSEVQSSPSVTTQPSEAQSIPTATAAAAVTEPSEVESSPSTQPSKAQAVPIKLNCPNEAAPVCQRSSSLASTLSLKTPQLSPTCPEYFRWIHEDLRPWKSDGITKELIESAKSLATFRLVVLDGRVYVEEYFGHSMTRNVFTLWGIIQLINRYPGRVPDLDLMFNCMDQPSVKSAQYSPSTLPPVFHYCKDDQTSDILFPDWSFWGWPDTNIKPWAPLMEEMKQANEEMKWVDREPYAFWKGNPTMGANRQELLQCNVTREQDWNGRIYTQDWSREEEQGYQSSNLAKQCNYRYRIYVDGLAWSVSQKYVMACDSPTLFIDTPWYEFFQRGLMPGHHYWPIPENDKCKAIKFAVDWGNKHHKEAQAMGKASFKFFEEEVKMDYVYDYMLHVLTDYAELLRYKPTVPEKATEICLESMACHVQDNVKKFMLESMEKSTGVSEPCKLPPPFAPEELRQLNDKKADAVRQTISWQQNARAERRRKF
ncbi:O-glucosyltransferase rumi-like [Zingiber officinale]|uniref:O-glucosyltransferase rumi-like n=1 Tax=Zingiber officinale TaxID=94328 RepID=UPI001C4D0DD8|nr:O-glucosyltransferase rumi-like [Zingiber officinale]